MSRKAFFTFSQLSMLSRTAYDAGVCIMERYNLTHTIEKKGDNSPVTEADYMADRIICEQLRSLTPDWPIVSEEQKIPELGNAPYFWLIDPLDGTRSFIRGSGNFTVNIALIERQTSLPVLGIIYDPLACTLYTGSAEGAFRGPNDSATTPIHVSQAPPPYRAITSHATLNSKTETFLAGLPISERTPCSSSIKFCRIAEGAADIYPRFGTTMEWDTAAGHAIVLAAGGNVTTPEGNPFLYGKPDFTNGAFVVKGFYPSALRSTASQKVLS